MPENKSKISLNQLITDQTPVVQSLNRKQIEDISSVLKNNWDTIKINYLISKDDFERYYFQYFKLAPTSELESILGLKGDDIDSLKSDLKSKETMSFAIKSSFLISYFLFGKRMPSSEPYTGPFEYGHRLMNLNIQVDQTSSVKGNLDYYDNRRDFDGQYQGKYGKFPED